MKNIYSLFIALFFAGISVINAQTGPGGIGNADGSNGQPRNILWLRANDLNISDGASVSTWPDSSGNGNDFGPSVNDPNDPVFYSDQLNTLPVVRFSRSTGTGTKLIHNSFTGFADDAITSIFIYKSVNTDDDNGIFSYEHSSQKNDYELRIGTLKNGNYQTKTYIDGSSKYLNVNLNDNSYKIVVHRWRSSDGLLELLENGELKGSTTKKSGYIFNDGGCLAIGGEQDGVDKNYDINEALNGDLAEVIMFASYLNDAERTIVENYLNVKYGIAISNDMFSTGDVSYKYDLTGVGQESNGNHVESSSAGFYIVADAGSLNDSEYILFAHNNVSNSVVTVNVPIDVEARWSRDWYLEKTGALNVTLKFDLREGIGGKYPQNIENYVLLYRNSTSGNYDTLKVTKNFGDADQVAFTISNADLLNGYYTLGTKNETESPLEGGVGITWYSLTSGNWSDWNTWTLDPSGALPNNPDHQYPQSGDETAIIKNGKVVIMDIVSGYLKNILV